MPSRQQVRSGCSFDASIAFGGSSRSSPNPRGCARPPSQRVDVRGVADEVVVEEERHGALAEPFLSAPRLASGRCAHRWPGRSGWCRTFALPVEADERLVAHGACRREGHGFSASGARTAPTHDFRDHVARRARSRCRRAARLSPSPGPRCAASPSARSPADEDRLSRRTASPSGTADGHHDVLELRGAFLRRNL